MAIFGNKKEEKKDTKKATSKAKSAIAKTKTAASKTKAPKAKNTVKAKMQKSGKPAGNVLLRPRITEKAAHLTARHVYTFDIHQHATKDDVVTAIHAVYGVKPAKVNVVKTIGKTKRLRTRRGTGTTSAMKKAYVYLKEGDRIEFAS